MARRVSTHESPWISNDGHISAFYFSSRLCRRRSRTTKRCQTISIVHSDMFHQRQPVAFSPQKRHIVIVTQLKYYINTRKDSNSTWQTRVNSRFFRFSHVGAIVVSEAQLNGSRQYKQRPKRPLSIHRNRGFFQSTDCVINQSRVTATWMPTVLLFSQIFVPVCTSYRCGIMSFSSSLCLRIRYGNQQNWEFRRSLHNES